MPLLLLAILVPVGIGLIVLAVRYSGISRCARIEDNNDALRLFSLDYPGNGLLENCIITADNKAAFLAMAGDDGKWGLGLVEVIGDRFITRELGHGDIRDAVLIDACNMKICYRDFTHNVARYGFSNEADLQRVRDWIMRLEQNK